MPKSASTSQPTRSRGDAACARLGTLILGAVLLLSALAEAQIVSRAVEVEFETRERALFPARFEWSYSTTRDWQERFRWLDALTRGVPGELGEAEEQFSAACLLDEHPDVRAHALMVLAHHELGLPEPLTMDLAEKLARDPLPRVRLNLARVLEFMPGVEVDTQLLALEEDSDQEVAQQARASLLARDEASLAAQLQLFQLEPLRLESDEYLEALLVLEHLPPRRTLLDGVDEIFAGATAASEETVLARRCLWHALRHGQRQRFNPLMIADGWGTPLEEADEQLERLRRARLLEAVERGNGQLHHQLMPAANKASQRATEEDDPDGLELASWYLEGARVSFYADPALRTRPEHFPISLDTGEELLLQFLTDVIGFSNAWTSQGLESYFEASPELREAALRTFGETWSRTGDPNSRRLLARALEYPDVAENAYRILVSGRHRVPEFPIMYRWWKSQPEARRYELLRHHARGVRFEPWRESLLNAWSRKDTRIVDVAELLAAFSEDEEVDELLWLWLHGEIRTLEESPVPDEQVTRGPWREAEARAQWLISAWLRVNSKRGVVNDPQQEIELLLRVGGLGRELGKLLVSHLVQSEPGRRATLEIIAVPGLSRRLRFEILLTNTDIKSADELRELFVGYDSCDEDLRLRILKRARGLDDPGVRARLLEVIRDRQAGAAERQLATEVLATTGGEEEVVSALVDLLGELRDYDLRQSVVEALGSRATQRDGLGLLQLYLDPESRELFADELLPAMVAIELRGQGVLSEEVTALWRAQAQDRAALELGKRFRSEDLPDRDFVYSGWLRAAQELLEAGQLELALGETYWQWDGRLLARLAELLHETNTRELMALAARIDLAALTAVLGEGAAPDRAALLLRLRARLLQAARWRGDWQAAGGWSRLLLDEWRTGGSTTSAIDSVFGGLDRMREMDPRGWILTVECSTRAWRALSEGRLDQARVLIAQARSMVGGSSQARAAVRRLEQALDQAGD
jgi:hypothetical protein